MHLADVIEAGDELIGDGVNLATRIQSSADPGASEVRAERAVIRVYGDAGNVIETHEHKGDFKEW